ncbi:MAG: hypothetical protein GY864_00615 [Desulfobacterales bacterium]|nr:hypothetical protein [Desulfobacterales bacterium]
MNKTGFAYYTQPDATVTIMRWAGLKHCGVLCKLTNSDSTMAKLLQVVEFAEDNGLSVLTIESLIS